MRYNKRIIERIKSRRAAEIWTNEVGMNKPTARVYRGMYYSDELIAIAVFRVKHAPSPTRVGVEYRFLGCILTKQVYTREEIQYLGSFLEKWNAKWFENKADGVLNIQYSPKEVSVLQYNPALSKYEVVYKA